MADPVIRTLDWKRPFDVLGGEASHFTPWLSSHLELLGAALGIEGLELQGTEHNIAGKRLDVLAAVGVEADGETVGVAIENQYGMSEHGHLGQLITYVAGVSAAYDRVLGVWLVDEVHAAHEAAVELLNRETTERLGFVLARARFVELANGEYGVDFDVVVRPNEFIKQEQKKVAASGNPERSAFMQELAEALAPDLKALGYTAVSPPMSGYLFNVSWGNSKARITVRASDPDDGLRATVYVNGFGQLEANEAFLTSITAHGSLITGALTTAHEFNPAAHIGNSYAKVAALAECRWPGFGYRSNVEDAAARLLEFATGVMEAIRASQQGVEA
jgi:hypothetical protein